MSYDLSIVVPSIRTQHWQRFVDSVKNSCKSHSCEIIFVGPFKTEVISDIPIKHIESYDRVGVCLQKGCHEAEGELLFHTVDDGILLEDSLDITIDFAWDNAYFTDIVNARYMEGVGFSGRTFPEQYWRAGTYPTVYGQSKVNPDWRLSLQPIMNVEFFHMIGGLDCRFEYSNHSHADLSFRVQSIGGRILHSPVDVSSAEHSQADHGPIQFAQENIDSPVFNKMWNEPRDKFILFDDYKQYEGRWERRFSKEYDSYESLCEGEGYET
jgi:hypothetical protein